jgi:hypothetical protein
MSDAPPITTNAVEISSEVGGVGEHACYGCSVVQEKGREKQKEDEATQRAHLELPVSGPQ